MTPEQKRRILAEARETFARVDAGIKTKPYTPPPGPPPPKVDDEFSWPRDTDAPCTRVPLVSAEPVEQWKRDALKRQHARLKANAEAKVRERIERSNGVYQQEQALEDRIMARVEERLLQMEDEVVHALRKIDAALDELADGIRDLQQQTSGRADKSRVIDLPGPLITRRRAS
jgi:hypothetical protein